MPALDLTNLDLQSLIDVKKIQSIMDDFFALTRMATAILDLQGNVIESTGWQDICTKFHRANPETARNCSQSDLFSATHLKPGEYIDYKCKNGLWDVVTPLYIGDRHMGNIYVGQFFYDDEQIDESFFIEQAYSHGFDKDAYLQALARVPRYNRKTIGHLMQFIVKFATYVSDVSLANLQYLQEIRDRKEAEQALANEAVRRRILVEQSRDGIVVLDQDGKVYEANRQFAEMLGYTPEEVQDLHVWDWDSILSPDGLMEMILNVDASGDHFETRHRRKDGRLIDVEISANGAVVGDRKLVFCVCRDISERKRVEEERERLMTAISQVGESILVTDSNGIIEYVNPTFEKASGYTSQEVVGKNPSMFRSAKHDSAFYRQLWEQISSGSSWIGRIVNKRKDGTLYTEATTISPVRDSSGDIVNYVAVSRDITDHLRLEHQFHQAQKMESVGRLAGGVAHDFNNVLSVIMGYTELGLEMIAKTDPFHANLKEILKAAEHSRDITRQLLAFARKQTIAPEVLDLNKTVESMLKMLRRLIGEDIDIAWLPGSGLWPIRIDPAQVDQILANLCVNARDAIAGVGKLSIETQTVRLSTGFCADHPGAVPGEYVLLSVHDDGSGMDRETLDHIFEPFFTTKALGQGTGLGLSTVYGIVKQNNGFIDAISQPGQGTTFNLYFSRYQGPLTDGSAVTDKVEVVNGQGETVLLVEDDTSILQLATVMLDTLGYNVVPVNSPAEAIRLTGQESMDIDLLLTDVVMPEMNGPALAQKMRTLYPELKCLFMSGYTSDVMAYRGNMEKELNFIHKPFTIRDLSTMLRRTLAPD